MIFGLMELLFGIIELIWNAPFWLVVSIIILIIVLYSYYYIVYGADHDISSGDYDSSNSMRYENESNHNYVKKIYEDGSNKVEQPFVFYDCNGYRCGRGDCFYDSHGYRRSWGGGFYDAKGYYRNWGDSFYDSQGNLVYPDW